MRSLLFIFALLPICAYAIEFPDSNLESVVRARLGIHDRPLTSADLATLTELKAAERSISDLSGLEHAINLETADLECNDLTDLSPLASLTKLRELDFGDNRVIDITPLAGLSALETLNAGGNEIVDISAVANLTSLTWVNVGFNRIVDIFPLRDLSPLEYLSLASNPIADFTAITTNEIRHLDLRSMWLDDISFLSFIDGLETLTLSSNRISDLRPLRTLTSLVYLALGDNRISEIDTLRDLPNLRHLSLYGNSVSNPAPLASHPSLEHVTLSENHLTDLAALATIPNLKSLEVSGNAIESVEPLSGINTLDWIYLDRNFIDLSDGSPAMGIIVDLELAGTRVYSDPQHPVEPVFIPDAQLEQLLREHLGYETPLTTLDLARLRSFHAEAESISDLTGLEHAIYLVELRLAENSISDLSPLADLGRLRVLELFENRITDVEPLRRLRRLEELDISENNIAATGRHFESLWRLESLEINDNPLTHLTLPNPFRLSYLDAGDCLITDISDLTRATSLVELHITRNPDLSDLSPIAALKKLWLLRANYLPLGAPGALEPLSDLPELEILWLAHCGITDVSALSDLPMLRSLYLPNNNITDPSPLASLPSVTVIELDDNHIRDFTSLTCLSSLAHFSLENNRISTIPDLSGLTSLLNIGLEHNAITDVTPLLSASDTVKWFKLDENFIDTSSPETRAVELEIRRGGAALILRGQRPFPAIRVPALSIHHDPRSPATITLSFHGELGHSYQLRFSEALTEWQPVAPPVEGNGSSVAISLPLPAAPRGFFTVVATPLP